MEIYSKKELKFIFNILKEKINKFDPAGVISMGAPKDEYLPELFQILDKIKKDTELKELKKFSDEIFNNFFGDEYNSEKVSEFSDEVYSVLKERKYVL